MPDFAELRAARLAAAKLLDQQTAFLCRCCGSAKLVDWRWVEGQADDLADARFIWWATCEECGHLNWSSFDE
jgi:hypothetical protein